jgi:hypothetical protein
MARLVAPRVKPGAEDFEILFSEFSVSVSGIRFEIHEYTLLEGVRFAELARVALEAHRNGNSGDLIYLLADNCKRDALEIAGLAEADFAALIAGYERANHRWLVAEKPKPGKPERWSSVVQSLASNGHTLEAIRGYTLRQINLFYEAIGRLTNKDRAGRIVDVSLGFGGGDEAKAALKSLQRAAE